MALIRVWADTRGESVCQSCGAPIEFVEVVSSGKRMPFDSPIIVVEHILIAETQREIAVIDTKESPSHFGTCPQAQYWKGRKR
jgi:hypothetical protein